LVHISQRPIEIEPNQNDFWVVAILQVFCWFYKRWMYVVRHPRTVAICRTNLYDFSLYSPGSIKFYYAECISQNVFDNSVNDDQNHSWYVGALPFLFCVSCFLFQSNNSV